MALPSYRKLHKKGVIKNRIENIGEILKNCNLCPQNCQVNRLNGEMGACNSDYRIKIASFGPHYGEENVLVGNKGSGTIFFSNCNLKCAYCQNFEISQYGQGYYIKPEKLAEIMMQLQNRGCHNINLVTPTHMLYGILQALEIACEAGLNLPLVYNSGGYENVTTLKLLEGIVDIYMPDIKYADNNSAREYSFADNYYDIAKKAVLEMHRQVGDLKTLNKIAESGLIIRHLVLPEDIAKTEKIIDFIAKKISTNTFFNLMDQYYPYYNADKVDKLNQKVDYKNFLDLLRYAKEKGLRMA